MNKEFWERFARSKLAVGGSIVILLLLAAAWLFRIIPFWLYFTILVVAVVSIIGYAILKEWLALRRDKSFERGMAAAAETQLKGGKARDRDAVREMHDRWKDGLEVLRRSKIGRGGRRAVYFLPWYLIIGKPATGKTSAIKNAGLHFPLGTPKTQGTGGTRNCDWFFTEEAIILDTAGRYAASEDNTTDREEWIAFLRLLRKYRRDMPINGVMVAVAVDNLLAKEGDELGEDARRMRNKLDELIGEFGIQFPVYLLVTKSDLIQGFTEFFGRLPKARLNELLGWTNPSWEVNDVLQLLNGAFDDLHRRFRSLRAVFLHDEQDPVALRNLFLFPEEFEAVTKNLSRYCDVLFRETKYSESPFLRGLYLTSGLQTGSTISQMLERLGLRSGASRLSEGSRSFFLQDFFQARLKTDKQLVAPTGRATIRWRIVNNVGVGAVVGVCVLVGLLSSASYVRNRTLLLSIGDSVAATMDLPRQPAGGQMEVIDEYREHIETLRYRNQHRSWLERFGLYSGQAVEKPVVARFMRAYEAVGYRPALANVYKALGDSRDSRRAFDAFGTLVGHLYATKPPPPADGGEAMAEWWNPVAGENEAMRARYAAAYRFYVLEPWGRYGSKAEQDRAERERSEQASLLREHLSSLLTVSEVRGWLDGGDPIRARDKEFNLPRGADGGAVAQAAFTPGAWSEVIVPMLRAVESIPGIDPDTTTRFAAQYGSQYYEEWFRFLLALEVPADSGYDPRVFCAADSPYMTVFERIREATTRPFVVERPAQDTGAGEKPDPAVKKGISTPESTPLIPGLESPAWIRALGRVTREKASYSEKMEPTCKTGTRTTNPCAHAIRLAGTGVDGGRPSLGELRDWVKNDLVAVSGATDSDDQRARRQVAKLLTVPIDRAEQSSARACVAALSDEFDDLRARFPKPWSLKDFEALFAPGASVSTLCNQKLAPFFNCLTLRPKLGAAVSVPSNLVAFVQQADRLQRALFYPGGGWRTNTITFESVPSTSDTGARVTQTVLTVFCSNLTEQPWSLAHRQTRAKKAIAWQPDQCGEARLRVMLGTPGGLPRTIELAKTGPFGLLELLNEARRSGNEFRWRFPNDGVTAAFRVWLPDQTILGYNRVSLPRR